MNKISPTQVGIGVTFLIPAADGTLWTVRIVRAPHLVCGQRLARSLIDHADRTIVFSETLPVDQRRQVIRRAFSPDGLKPVASARAR